MSAGVPSARPATNPGGIGFGKPVRSFDWQGIGALGNYVRGRGASLIPRHTVAETIAIATTGTFRYRVKTNQFAKYRVWTLELLGATAGVASSVSISFNGGSAFTFYPSSSRASVVPAEFYELIGSPAQAEAEINVAITTSATAAVTVLSVACCELPMAGLSFLTDGGNDLGRLAPIAPVDVFALGTADLGSSNATIGALNGGRRVGMHHFATAAGLTSSSTVNVPLYTAACEAPCLGRFLYSGDTTRLLTVKAYGKITGGATFTVTVSMTNGATVSITTTSAGLTWFGGSTIAVDAEDMTTADGRRSARYDLAKIEYKSSSGAQVLSLYSVSIWEDLAV